MNCSPTLTAEEFKVLHNTLWELGRINNPTVEILVERIRKVALKGAYEQDNQAFESKMDYYRWFQNENQLKAIWSMYELEEHGFLRNHPYKDATHVTYNNHQIEINGKTWADLYRAANQAIIDSGDWHHIFIESFRPDVDKPSHLCLGTGS